jgi:hypothetical protein
VTNPLRLVLREFPHSAIRNIGPGVQWAGNAPLLAQEVQGGRQGQHGRYYKPEPRGFRDVAGVLVAAFGTHRSLVISDGATLGALLCHLAPSEKCSAMLHGRGGDGDGQQRERCKKQRKIDNRVQHRATTAQIQRRPWLHFGWHPSREIGNPWPYLYGRLVPPGPGCHVISRNIPPYRGGDTQGLGDF